MVESRDELVENSLTVYTVGALQGFAKGRDIGDDLGEDLDIGLRKVAVFLDYSLVELVCCLYSSLGALLDKVLFELEWEMVSILPSTCKCLKNRLAGRLTSRPSPSIRTRR